MSPDAHSLDCITIDVPCPASWDTMTGNERVRFCSHCQLNVYNLSAMSREEAEDRLRQSDGRLCVRLYRRPDGTVLTRDCRVAFHSTRRQLRLLLFLLVGVPLISFWWTVSVLITGGGLNLRGAEPIKTILNWLNPQPPPALMGKPVLPPAPGTPVCDPEE